MRERGSWDKIKEIRLTRGDKERVGHGKFKVFQTLAFYIMITLKTNITLVELKLFTWECLRQI